MPNQWQSKVGAVLLMGCAFLILWRAGLPELNQFTVTDLEGNPIQAPYEGGITPNFERETLAGDRFTPELVETPLIINFWATWCIPCITEMPVLDQLYRDGLMVVGINVGLEDDETVTTWLAQTNIQFPIIVDDDQRSLEQRYRVTGLPTTFFVDANGRIQYVQRGELTPETLTAGLVAIGIE